MPKTEWKNNNLGKAHNKSTLISTSPIEDLYSKNSLEGNQDTDLRRTIVDMFKEIKEYTERIRELRKENEKFRKELERKNEKLWKELEEENDKLQKEVQTVKRSHAEMKKETDQQSKELQEENDKLQK